MGSTIFRRADWVRVVSPYAPEPSSAWAMTGAFEKALFSPTLLGRGFYTLGTPLDALWNVAVPPMPLSYDLRGPRFGVAFAARRSSAVVISMSTCEALRNMFQPTLVQITAHRTNDGRNVCKTHPRVWQRNRNLHAPAQGRSGRTAQHCLPQDS